jgi:hypothetical protein
MRRVACSTRPWLSAGPQQPARDYEIAVHLHNQAAIEQACEQPEESELLYREAAHASLDSAGGRSRRGGAWSGMWQPEVSPSRTTKTAYVKSVLTRMRASGDRLVPLRWERRRGPATRCALLAATSSGRSPAATWGTCSVQPVTGRGRTA